MNVIPIGFGERPTAAPKAALEKAFTPEFRNRLDAVIHFSPLDQSVMLQVVDKFLVELSAQLAERDVRLKVSPSARRELAKQGYDPLFGARPLARLIQSELSDPLAGKILFGELLQGGEVRVGIRGGKFTFSFH